MKKDKSQNKRPKKSYHRFWGLAKRLEHTRIKGKQNKQKNKD